MSAERPIIFSGPMVRAILESKKSQTRRLAKVNDHDCKPGFITPNAGYSPRPIAEHAAYCPYGVPGDRLWVREKFSISGNSYFYGTDADGTVRVSWRPAIHMPRAACRLVLEVVSVRVERLQEISEQDAEAEGVDRIREKVPMHRDAFRYLWDDINAKRAPWSSNPWVWVVEFKRAAEKPHG